MSEHTLYPLQEVAPRGPLPRRRLRAVLPLVLGGLLAWPAMTGGLVDFGLLVLGLLGAVTLWRADARSGLDAWQRAFPGVRFGGIRTLPTDLDGVRALARVSEEVSLALRGLRDAPRRSPRQALAALRARRELQRLPAHAAALAVEIERLAAIPDPRVEPRRRRLTEQLAVVAPLARRIRAAALRQDVNASSAPTALRALDDRERAWSAALDCADELDELEALMERTSA